MRKTRSVTNDNPQRTVNIKDFDGMNAVADVQTNKEREVIWIVTEEEFRVKFGRVYEKSSTINGTPIYRIYETSNKGVLKAIVDDSLDDYLGITYNLAKYSKNMDSRIFTAIDTQFEKSKEIKNKNKVINSENITKEEKNKNSQETFYKENGEEIYYKNIEKKSTNEGSKIEQPINTIKLDEDLNKKQILKKKGKELKIRIIVLCEGKSLLQDREIKMKHKEKNPALEEKCINVWNKPSINDEPNKEEDLGELYL